MRDLAATCVLTVYGLFHQAPLWRMNGQLGASTASFYGRPTCILTRVRQISVARIRSVYHQQEGAGRCRFGAPVVNSGVENAFANTCHGCREEEDCSTSSYEHKMDEA